MITDVEYHWRYHCLDGIAWSFAKACYARCWSKEREKATAATKSRSINDLVSHSSLNYLFLRTPSFSRTRASSPHTSKTKQPWQRHHPKQSHQTIKWLDLLANMAPTGHPNQIGRCWWPSSRDCRPSNSASGAYEPSLRQSTCYEATIFILTALTAHPTTHINLPHIGASDNAAAVVSGLSLHKLGHHQHQPPPKMWICFHGCGYCEQPHNPTTTTDAASTNAASELYCLWPQKWVKAACCSGVLGPRFNSAVGQGRVFNSAFICRRRTTLWMKAPGEKYVYTHSIHFFLLQYTYRLDLLTSIHIWSSQHWTHK